jgi:hypothetical protein
MTVATPAPDASPAPVPGAPETARPVDEYLLEVYRQTCDNSRMYATSRFSNLSAFLTYVSLLTAGLAVLLSGMADTTGPLIPMACTAVGCMGLIVSVLFFALEIRHHHYWKYYEQTVKDFEGLMGHTQYPKPGHSFEKRNFVAPSPLKIGATDATYGIYLASVGFFLVAIVLSLALAIVRS